MGIADPVTGDRAHARGGGLLATVCAAQFMVVLDVSVVNLALPSIRARLGFDVSTLPWVVNAYLLTFAGLLLLGGRLADLFGHRRMLLSGLAIFTVASLVGGLASSAGVLVVARAVQGVGAAVLAPATLTILTTAIADGPARTRALAAWTAVGLAGGTVGNLLGGMLTEFLSWRSTLLINVPLGLLTTALSLRHIPADTARGEPVRLDITGAVLATAGLGSLAFGIGQAGTAGWQAGETWGSIAIGLVLLTGFWTAQARWSKAPLMPLPLLRIRSVGVGNVALLLAGACLTPMWYFLSLSMQHVLNYSPLRTGLAFLPHTVVTIVIATRLTPWLMARLDARVVIAAGSTLAAAGFWWQSLLTPASGYLTGILGPAVVFSTGSGLMNTPITKAVTSGVHPAAAGAASGLMNTSKQIGGGLGLAALAWLTVASNSGDGTTTTTYGHAFAAMAVVMLIVAGAAWLLPAHCD